MKRLFASVLAVGFAAAAGAQNPPPATSDGLPPVRAWRDRNPEADRRLKAAKPAVEEHAGALGMPTENLLTPELLRRVAWQPPEPATADAVGDALTELGARRWQVAQTAHIIADAFVASVQAVEDAPEAAS